MRDPKSEATVQKPSNAGGSTKGNNPGAIRIGVGFVDEELQNPGIDQETDCADDTEANETFHMPARGEAICK